MLAYVFWHWPRPALSPEEYETHLRAFHASLRRNLPAGMKRSFAWRVEGAAWLPAGHAYEDWYLLEDSSALDSIDRLVDSGETADPHDAVAALAAGGTAGLYRPVLAAEGRGGTAALWFGKPPGLSYAQLYQALDEYPPPGPTQLWQRMLTLGPTPEFCLIGDEPRLPRGWPPIVLRRSPIWP
ncbi:MAG: hypothetical protein JOZ41_14500 [Chloroflexi bacterium]|nr:hypothetical protein [Chloroflexota bacterium]